MDVFNEIIRDVGKDLNYEEIETYINAFSNNEQLVLRTPDYIRVIVAYDKENGIDLTARVLLVLEEIGRRMIVADRHFSEDEVSTLTKHIAHLRGFAESRGVPAYYDSNADKPGTVVKATVEKEVKDAPPLDESLTQLHHLVGLR